MENKFDKKWNKLSSKEQIKRLKEWWIIEIKNLIEKQTKKTITWKIKKDVK